MESIDLGNLVTFLFQFIDNSKLNLLYNENSFSIQQFIKFLFFLLSLYIRFLPELLSFGKTESTKKDKCGDANCI